MGLLVQGRAFSWSGVSMGKLIWYKIACDSPTAVRLLRTNAFHLHEGPPDFHSWGAVEDVKMY